jgi:sortase A
VWTNVEAHQQQDAVTRSITDDWRREGPQTPERKLTPADFGKGFAFLRIPRLGADFTVPVVEGVRAEDLARGVGHYPKTAGPGEIGNFAVAGHRATHGEPFRNLDRMRVGDVVVVETKDTWFTYVVDRTEIVQPTDVWVIDPVPGKEGVTPTQRLLTLTTCHPRWASTHRLIVFTHLKDQQPTSQGLPSVLSAVGR